jgi:DNA-directed RNA polymerase specialized sigma24 family protein
MTKEELRAYQTIKREAAQIERELERLEAEMYGPRGSQLDDMPKAPHHKPGGPVESLAIRHADLVTKYREFLAALKAQQLRIEEAINGLEPRQRMLMRYRYIDGLEWEEVCVAMKYSWTQTHRIHAEALKRLEEVKT